MSKKFLLFFIAIVGVAAAVAFVSRPAPLRPDTAVPGALSSYSPSFGGHPPAVVVTASPAAKQVTAKSTPLFLPYVADRFGQNAWTANWGSFSIQNGALTFGATSSTTGGTVLLNGSDAWTDYAVQADVLWTSGKALDIFARFSDAHNFSYCNFGAGYAGIIERTNDVETALGEKGGLVLAASGAQILGIRVYKDKIACTVDGRDVVTGVSTAAATAEGGIGFSLWDPVPGASKAEITHLSVVPLTADDIVLAAPAANAAQNAAAASSSLEAGGNGTSSSVPAPTTATGTVPAAAPSVLTLPYSRTDFSHDANWMGTWGNVAPDASGALRIAALPDGTGGSVFLANTEIGRAHV
jgi:hypothetical protein